MLQYLLDVCNAMDMYMIYREHFLAGYDNCSFGRCTVGPQDYDKLQVCNCCVCVMPY